MKASALMFAVVVLASGVLASGADAATATRDDLVHAQGACQPTVPTSSLRAYSTGLRNAGTTSIYVTCAVFGQYYESAEGSSFIRVAVGNVNGSLRAISCTLSTGWTSSVTAGQVTQGVFPKQINVAGNSLTFIDFSAETVLGAADRRFSNASVTCLLQPYTEIKWIRRVYAEEIGT